MRRWLVVLTVVALAVGLVALPGAAKEKQLPEQVVFAEGEFRMGAIEARTGEYAGYIPSEDSAAIGGVAGWTNFMDPNYNYCLVTEATLTWTGKNTAVLVTLETCSPRGGLPSPYPLPRMGSRATSRPCTSPRVVHSRWLPVPARRRGRRYRS